MISDKQLASTLLSALLQASGTMRFGLLEWPALLKKLDKIDPSYRK